MGSDYYMMEKWEREQRFENGEYIERKTVLSIINKQIDDLEKEIVFASFGEMLSIERSIKELKCLAEDIKK